MFEHASPAVQATISRAADEAALRGDRRVGTDHLLLGLLHDPDSARTLGADLDQARAAARQLDREALAALGIDPGEATPTRTPVAARHAPPTSGMRATLARAFALAAGEHTREVQPRHLLRALLELKPPDPAADLLRALGGSKATTRPGSA